MEGKKIKIWVIGLFLALFVGQFLVGGSVGAQNEGSSFWRPAWLDNALANVWSRLGPSAIRSQADLQATYRRYLNSLETKLNDTSDPAEIATIKAEIEKTKQQMDSKNLEKDYADAMKKSQADQRVAAAADANALEKVLGRMFAWLLYYIASGFGWILSKVVGVMLIVATYNDFLKQEAVVTGWKITRDICNNFFIILLLVTAIGTMLRQQAYQWKAMLPKILIAAVLINFSMMFCGIMIDVSQVFTLTFASPIATSSGYNIILASIGLPNYQNFGNALNNAAAQGGTTSWDYCAALFYAIIMTIVTLVVVVIFTAMLIYRIIMLWFLVVLSPLPFLLNTFDKGKTYAGQWWGMFTKNLIFGPVMMFFLFLSFVTMSTFVGTNGQGGQTKNALGLSTSDTANPSAIGSAGPDLSNMFSVNGMINAMIIIGLLVGSLYMGQQIGGTGAKFAGQGLDFLKTRAKKYSGFNLGKNAAIGATKLPGKAATAIDDKLGLRQKLYSGAYSMGGKYIPGTKGFFGGKMRGLEDATKKRNNQYYADVASARGIDKMDEKKLRAVANGRNKAEAVAAAQALMKKGLINDNDPTKQGDNLAIVKKARENLRGTELGDTFDDNLRKYHSKLAMNTIYTDKDNKINVEKMKSDLATGKLDINKVMGSMDEATMNKLKVALGNTEEALSKFMLEQAGDDLEKLFKSTKNKEVKKMISAGVSEEMFRKKDANGRDISNGYGGFEHNEDQRAAFLSATQDVRRAYGKIDSTTGNFTGYQNSEAKNEADKYISKNRAKVMESMPETHMDRTFMEDHGHLFTDAELTKFGERGTDAFNALQKSINQSIAGVDFSTLQTQLANAMRLPATTTAEIAVRKDQIEGAQKAIKQAELQVKRGLSINGSLEHGSFDALTNDPNGFATLQRIVRGLSAVDANNLKTNQLDTTSGTTAQNFSNNAQKIFIGQHISNSVATRMASRGENIDEVEMIDRVKRTGSP